MMFLPNKFMIIKMGLAPYTHSMDQRPIFFLYRGKDTGHPPHYFMTYMKANSSYLMVIFAVELLLPFNDQGGIIWIIIMLATFAYQQKSSASVFISFYITCFYTLLCKNFEIHF